MLLQTTVHWKEKFLNAGRKDSNSLLWSHWISNSPTEGAIWEVFSGHCLVTVGVGFKIRRHNIVLDPFSSLRVFLTAACTAHSCSWWNKSWSLLGWDKYMKRGPMSLGKKDQHFNVRVWRKSISILNHVPGTFSTSCVCTGLIIHFLCKLETLGSSQTRRTRGRDKWVKKNDEGTCLPKRKTN